MHSRRLSSQEAGFKYFVLGGFASAFLLYGIALVYGATGTTNLVMAGTFFEAGELPVMAALGLCLLLIGFLLLPVVLIGAFVLEVLAAIAANRGEWYRFPINLRLVPGAQG